MKLQLIDLTKSYGDNIILDSCSYTFEANSLYIVYGSNGAGKTTLLKTISGLTEFESGTIIFNNISIKEIVAYKRSIGSLLFESYVIDELTVGDYLKYICDLYRVDRNLQASYINEYYNYFWDDRDVLNTKCGHLSTGNKKKLLTFCSIVHRPKLILLDEPFANLDHDARRRLSELLHILRDKSLIIVTSHTSYKMNIRDYKFIIVRDKCINDSTYQDFEEFVGI